MFDPRTVYQITWHLSGNRKIVKRDEGSQQAFTKMSRAERNAITLDCLRVTYDRVVSVRKGN